MKRKYINRGGLWKREKLGRYEPRWQGVFRCECGKRHELLGWGKDQLKNPAENAPLIVIKAGVK